MARLRGQQLFNTALIGAVFCVILDRLAKVFSYYIWQTHPIAIIKNAVSLSFSSNYNISFSLNTYIDPVYITAPLIVVVMYYLWLNIANHNYSTAAALSFIAIGSISNIFDRLRYGFVIDYLDLRYFATLNLADIMISAGVIYICLSLIKQQNNKKP